jgi:type II secretory pathway pseudopilin PulG
MKIHNCARTYRRSPRSYSDRNGCPTDRRPAFALIEMIVVVSLTSIVISGLAMTLHLLFRADRELRRDVTYAMVLPRLASQLRSDVHAAREVHLSKSEDGNDQIRIVHSDGTTVQYQTQNSRIQRMWLREQQVLHREQFRLGKRSFIRWVRLAGPPPILQLHIRRGGSGEEPFEFNQRNDLIEAAIGLDTAHMVIVDL